MSHDISGYTDNLTQISRVLYDAAVSSDMTLAQAAAYLKENACLRTLHDTILKYASEPDSAAFRKKLTRGLQLIHPSDEPDTVRRRINDWMNTPERSIDKTSAIELCFVLNLSRERADAFLTEITEEGFHYRNPEEIVYSFALDRGMSYVDAQRLIRQIGDLNFVSRAGAVPEDTMTQTIRSEIKLIDTEEELLEYIRQAQSRLGRMHQTAYQMFGAMIEQLQNPDKSEQDVMNWSRSEAAEMKERRLSVKEVLNTYLHREDIPRSKRSASLTPLHRALLAQWPTEKEISQMRTRTIDINRKTLLLLYLATEDLYGAADEDEYDLFDAACDDDLDFRTALQLINAMLGDCGFCPLDPRRPFDWMVLHCLCGEDLFMMDVQIQQFLRMLYGDETKK